MFSDHLFYERQTPGLSSMGEGLRGAPVGKRDACFATSDNGNAQTTATVRRCAALSALNHWSKIIERLV